MTTIENTPDEGGSVRADAQRREDAAAARLVARFQAGEVAVFYRIYEVYFDRVYTYLRLATSDAHEAEDLTQQVFLDALESLPSYEQRGKPFRAWLFTVARNRAIEHLRKHGRVDPEPAERLNRRRENGDDQDALNSLAWITDVDLVVLIGRLPPAQRQVIALRYILDLSHAEIAQILDRSPKSIRMLQHRALDFLRKRLVALGRDPHTERRVRSARPLRRSPVLYSRRFGLTAPGPTR